MELKPLLLHGMGFLFALAGAFAIPGMAQEVKRDSGLYAIFETNHGSIVAELFETEAPVTVSNFVELAEGKKEWTHPDTGEKSTARYYDGTVFHRLIPEFMIQGGDPTGTGRGGPGYQFKNEYSVGLTFNKGGRLAMANSGPNTNGSQFFITEKAVGLDSKDYTIFGQVIEGLDVVKEIARVPKDPTDTREKSRPAESVRLEKLTIERVEAE
jgi:peptidyl-prolyl cis-trans isomerase A (cyclophilin A)